MVTKTSNRNGSVSAGGMIETVSRKVQWANRPELVQEIGQLTFTNGIAHTEFIHPWHEKAKAGWSDVAYTPAKFEVTVRVMPYKPSDYQEQKLNVQAVHYPSHMSFTGITELMNQIHKHVMSLVGTDIFLTTVKKEAFSPSSILNEWTSKQMAPPLIGGANESP